MTPDDSSSTLLLREQRRATQMQGLAEAALSINTAETLDGILETLARQAATLIGAHHATARLAVGLDGARLIHASFHTDPELPATGNPLAVPLIARDGTNLGSLQLSNRRDGDFTAEDERLLTQLAHLAAVAIENARLTEQIREQAETLETLNRVGASLAAELDQDKLVQAITDAATELSGAQFGAFFYNVLDERGGSYMLYNISGVPKEHFAKFPMPRNTAIFAPTFDGTGILRLDDVTKDPRYGQNTPYHGMPKGHLPVRSYLAVPVVSRHGKVIGGLFFGHSVPGVFTARAEQVVAGLASQAAVAMDNARLFQEAQQLIRALERSNTELDQFAYVASHDLKAPLRGIANLSQWLEEDLGSRLNEENRKQMGLLRGRVFRMEALIDGILSYSRASRAHRPERIDVSLLLAEITELLAPPKEASIHISPHLPTLTGERVPLQQVFLNLLGNALKHARRGDARVEVGFEERAEEYEFHVRDNGPGIAPEYHERIWGLFQTLEPRDRVEGTGIGLSVVKKIVESRGGRAWVESAEGTGATFRFTWLKAGSRPGASS